MDANYDLRKIKSKQYRRKDHFFKQGEGNTLLMDLVRDAKPEISTPEIIEAAARRKGFDLESIDKQSFSASLFTILKRLQSKGVVEEVGRVDGVIRWGLVSTG